MGICGDMVKIEGFNFASREEEANVLLTRFKKEFSIYAPETMELTGCFQENLIEQTNVRCRDCKYKTDYAKCKKFREDTGRLEREFRSEQANYF
jgi:hypothetical protein